MRLSALALLLAMPAAAAPAVQEAPREVPRIILPGAPMGLTPGAAPSLYVPRSGPLVAPEAKLIVPESPVIQAPAPSIVTAARPMTEAEAAPQKLPGKEELAALAKALSASSEGAPAPSDAARGASLETAFDGALAPEAKHWDDVSAEFARGPKAPELPVVARAARSLIARLLPSLYKRVPARVQPAADGVTGHTWTAERGHVIEVAPSRPDARGEVADAFGEPGRRSVQQKIEQLAEAAHEYFHVIFDAAVGARSEHGPHTAYAAATEGFAVTGEQLLIERLLEHAPALGLGPRDTMDLSEIASARREWLDLEDNHYSEGILAWRSAYRAAGLPGVSALLGSLSGPRMAEVPRTDAAYQLALGDHELLAAYLGRDSSARAGLDAFARAARGETLPAADEKLAAAAVERAGSAAWTRLFERSFLPERRIKTPQDDEAPSVGWFNQKEPPRADVAPAFAAARLSPQAGAALARFLAATISERGGAAKLFGRPGPGPRLNELAAAAEALPWTAAQRQAWDAGLMRWVLSLD